MKAEVTQASTAAVATGVRPARKTGGTHVGFHSVLGNAHASASSAVPAKGDQAAKGKADLHDWRQRGVHKATQGAKADASATVSPGASAELKLDVHLAKLLGKVDGQDDKTLPTTDDPDVSLADDDDAPTKDRTDDICMPTQMKAEQTISAMMAMKPASQVSGERAKDDAEPIHVQPADTHTADRKGAAGVGEPKAKVTIETAGKAHPAAPAEPAKPVVEAQAMPDGDEPASPVSKQAEERPTVKSSVATVAAAAASEAPAPQKSAPKDVPKPERATRPQADAASPRAATSQTAAAPVAQPATGHAGGTGSRIDADNPKDGRQDAPSTADQRHDAPPAAAKVSVMAQQSAPAPAVASANATAIASAIGADQARQLASSSPVQQAQVFRNAQPMRSLKIQLHPAELGVVTANLKAAGEQLHVELQVENHEAYRRLSADHDTIVKSLQSLGYDIDRVSIQQPQAVSTTAARVETNLDSGSFSRDASAFQSGNSGSGSERSNGQANGRRHGGDAQGSDQPQAIVQNRAGSGVYI